MEAAGSPAAFARRRVCCRIRVRSGARIVDVSTSAASPEKNEGLADAHCHAAVTVHYAIAPLRVCWLHRSQVSRKAIVDIDIALDRRRKNFAAGSALDLPCRRPVQTDSLRHRAGGSGWRSPDTSRPRAGGGAELPYITLFPAIMVSAWAGGLGSGLLTTFLAAVGAAYFWVPPLRSLWVTEFGEFLGLSVFVGELTKARRTYGSR